MSDMDSQQKVAEMIKETRREQDGERFRSMEKHARCALLPSPEKLDESIGSPGSDKTDTLGDFDLVKDWVTKSGLLNTEFYDSAGKGENLHDGVYYSFIQFAFSSAFAPMRNTKSPELPELVFWYYAGHGLSKKVDQLSYLSTPCLDRVQMIPGYHEAADEFVKEGRKVKGGELCLHKVGFCDLYGLLKPWIAAVKAESINAKGCSKKNKHLAIILDSCYSGKIAQELETFKNEMNTRDLSFLQENSVTIQAACGPDQGALGGYFTPCFVYLNDPDKAELLNKLKTEWNDMTEEKKNEYKSLEFPSPMVVTTRIPITVELKVQDFNLTLFQDPGFFQFCSSKHLDNEDHEDPKQATLGGYFTPCFVYLNDPDKAELLNELKTEWNDMTEEKKNEYRSLELPSPMVVTTIPQDGTITMELKVQNFNLTLFQDPGFFQFCSMKVSHHQDDEDEEPKQGAHGGFFSPCFVFLNDPEKAELLNELKTEWNGMTEEKKNKYKSLELPSPMAFTTIRDQDGNITMELEVQNFNLTLFQNPGFFKFCSVKVYQHQDKSLFYGKERVLTPFSANIFMTSRPFEVLDYKLKTYQGHGPYANTPMGLFLLKDHHNVGKTVCAHIHFDRGLVAQRINLVHHKKPPVGSVQYLEDHYGLTGHQISMNLHKAPVPILDGNAQDLVQACRAYVDGKQPGRWNNISQWNMTGFVLGVNGLFRDIVEERHNERSAWEVKYLDHIKKFGIPVVADN